MKAITLWQPWASAISYGLKEYETRHWPTHYRGPLLIHAATWKIDADGIDTWETAQGLSEEDLPPVTKLPRGAIVAVCDVVDCLLMDTNFNPAFELPKGTINTVSIGEMEELLGNWERGRYAWKLANVHKLINPIPCKGAQGLWVPHGIGIHESNLEKVAA